jgi:hypothetical protein
MSRIAFLTILATACLAAAPVPGKLKTGDPFYGKWKITVTPNGTDANLPGVKEFDETLEFTPEKMSAKVMGEHGFKPADYNEDLRVYGPAKFTCTQNSDKEGKAEWGGFTTGTEMQGTLVWTKKDGTIVHYDFTGDQQ